jgi:hypothetical protein
MKNDNNKHVIDFDSSSLRGRISKAIKHLRDEGDEVKHPQAKRMPFIPVTGGKNPKYFDNKSHEKI